MRGQPSSPQARGDLFLFPAGGRSQHDVHTWAKGLPHGVDDTMLDGSGAHADGDGLSPAHDPVLARGNAVASPLRLLHAG
jgi:hypothetical protein